MPRKAKENKIVEDENTASVTTTSKASGKKKDSSKKMSTKDKKTNKSTKKAKTTTVTKKETKKVSAKNTTKKADTKKAGKKTSIIQEVKKLAKRKKIDSRRKIISFKTSSKPYTKNKAKEYIAEYYDLPYKYNKTVVKILAQTPNTLFVYWEISDEDKLRYINKYGENFFTTTRPVLIVRNKDLNYFYEVPINDFANSWYIRINDAKTSYEIELGRRPIYSQVHDCNLSTDYIYISSSNTIEAPNDHILFDKLGDSVFFRNVKTNKVEKKKISTLSFMTRIEKLHNIKDLYSLLYKDELNVYSDSLDLRNPSSGNPTSVFK